MYLVLFILHLLECALAAPTTLHARQNNTQMTPSLYVPVVLVIFFMTLATVLACRSKQVRQRWRTVGSAIGSQFRQVPRVPSADGAATTRELTAEELAGGTTNNTTTTNGNRNRTTTTTTAATRRARRARRTPSQISTKSLPAYNKDPGDEELVIYRGPSESEDDEDEPLGSGTARSMSTIQEQTPSQISQDLSHSRVSLLRHEAGQDVSSQTMPSSGLDTARSQSSFDTMNASDESSSALLARLDPRGEAPPYEVVNLNDEQQGNTRLSPGPEEDRPNNHEEHQSTPVSERPRSRFLNFFMPRSNNSEAESRRAGSHARYDSGPSFPTLTSVESHGGPLRLGGRARRGHRSNNSSGSGLSLSAFRTISRTGSNLSDATGPAASTSLISLNSISAPLTHTAIRTEFTYPRSGPTPDQVKFISSRETFGRFGLPYGPDAIAFAASASRQDLMPPPDFETIQTHAAGSVSDLNGDLPSLPTETNGAQSSTESTNDVTSTNESSSTSSSSSSSSSSHDSDIVVSSNEPVPDESLPAQNQKPVLSADTSLPPPSFLFEINQSFGLDGERSLSIASSDATFDTVPDSEPLTPNGPTVHIIAASTRTSMVSMHTAEPGIETDDGSDDGESIRLDSVPVHSGNKGIRIEEIGDSDSEDEESEGSHYPTEENVNGAKHTETAVTTDSPQMVYISSGPADSADS